MRMQIETLYEGGVDIFLVETIFDTLNAKAAIYALEDFFAAKDVRIPVFISGTIVDNSGRTLSGQTNEAFWNSVRHAAPFAIGLNCALGAKDMLKYIDNLSRCADCYVFCYPNAGLPNAMGGYDQKGSEMADEVRPFCENRIVNALGGCCGSTGSHIAALRKMAGEFEPRERHGCERLMRISGALLCSLSCYVLCFAARAGLRLRLRQFCVSRCGDAARSSGAAKEHLAGACRLLFTAHWVIQDSILQVAATR